MTPFTFTLLNLALFAAMSSALPRLTRPELFFAVTVTTEFRRSKTAAQIVKLYNILGWSGTALTMLLLIFRDATTPWATLAPTYPVSGAEDVPSDRRSP